MRLQKSSLCNQLLPNDFCCQLANSWSTTIQCNAMCSLCQNLLDFWSPVQWLGVVKKTSWKPAAKSSSLFLTYNWRWFAPFHLLTKLCLCLHFLFETCDYPWFKSHCTGENQVSSLPTPMFGGIGSQTSDDRLTRGARGYLREILGGWSGAVKMRKRRK